MAFCPAPKLPNGLTQADERDARRQTAAAELLRVHRLIDQRDGGRCRVCRHGISPAAVQRRDRLERHHLVPRSLGGEDTTANLCCLCVPCHDERHKKGTLRLSGDADLRDERGRLAGIKVERLRESGWQVVGMR